MVINSSLALWTTACARRVRSNVQNTHTNVNHSTPIATVILCYAANVNSSCHMYQKLQKYEYFGRVYSFFSHPTHRSYGSAPGQLIRSRVLPPLSFMQGVFKAGGCLFHHC